MQWSDITGFIGQAAPLLGGVLAGPAGAAAGRLVASALGVDSSPDAVHALAVLRSEVERVPGVRVEIAAAQYLSAVSANTGLNTEPLRKALPSTIKPQPSLNATAVGKLVGCSAAEANRRLEAAGLQRRDARGEWALTPAGTQYGAALPYANGKHSGYQVLWLESVARLIQSKAA